MPLNPEIRYYINGEEVNQSILNRPLGDIEDNLNSIYEVVDGIPPYRVEDIGKYVRVNGSGTGLVYDEIEFLSIRTPSPVFPLEGASNVIANPQLEASEYAPIYSVDVRAYREFQLDLEGEGFSNPIRTEQVNSDTWIVSPDLSAYSSSTFVWRCRDVTTTGETSEWSPVQTFTTAAAYVKTPSIYVEEDGNKAVRAPQLIGSEFGIFGSTDTHTETDWEVRKTLDNTLVWSSYNNTTDLETIQVPDQTLDINTEYNFRVRYSSSSYGDSSWGSTTKTTVDYYVKTPTLSTNDTGVEFDKHTVTITNYDNNLTYVINVSGGTYIVSGDTISWTLPEVTQTSTHQITVYALNQYTESSATASKNVEVLDVPTIADDAYIITDFSLSVYNNQWSI